MRRRPAAAREPDGHRAAVSARGVVPARSRHAIASVFTADLLLVPSPVYAGDAWIGTTTFVVVPVLLTLALLAFHTATGEHRRARRLEAGASEP